MQAFIAQKKTTAKTANQINGNISIADLTDMIFMKSQTKSSISLVFVPSDE